MIGTIFLFKVMTSDKAKFLGEWPPGLFLTSNFNAHEVVDLQSRRPFILDSKQAKTAYVQDDAI
jgi:hypothetical protein